MPTIKMSTELDIDHVAALARLTVTPEERVLLSRQLRAVLEHLAIVEEVDVEGVEPMPLHATQANVFRPDQALRGLTAEAALSLAPDRTERFFLVPRVVE